MLSRGAPCSGDWHGSAVRCSDMSKNSSLLSPESIGLFALGLGFLLLSGAGVGASTGAGAAGAQFSFDAGFQFEYALVLFALAISSIALRLADTSLAHEISQLAGSRMRVSSISPWIAAAIFLFVLLAVPLLAQPLRYDEVFTRMFFIDGPWADLFYYPLPNNHVLFTVLAAGFDAAFGPTAMRWPAMIFGIAAIPITFHACRKLAGRNAGYLAAFGMALCPFLVSFATLARGYSFLVMVVVAMIAVVADDEWFPWRVKPAALALLAAISVGIMPSAVYALAGIAVWAASAQLSAFGSLKLMIARLAAPSAALSLLFSAMLYIPVLLVNRFQLIADNRFFEPLPWREFIAATGPHLEAASADLVRGVPAGAVVMLVALVLLGLLRKSWRLASLLPAMLAGSGAIFLVKQSIPFARTWIYLIPVVLIAADAGFAWLLDQKEGARKLALPALLMLASTSAWSLERSGLLESSTEGGVSPDAEAMANAVNRMLSPNDWLCSTVPHDVLLRHYLEADHPMPRAFNPNGRVFYVVHGPFAGNQFVRPADALRQADVGTLSLYRLRKPMTIEHSGKSFHCWLRAGVFQS